MKNNKKIGVFIAALIVATAIIATGIYVTQIPKDEGIENLHNFPFEKGMDGWKADGTDLDNPPIEWSIERTDNYSYAGNHSVRLYLDNMNDAGKIWMEKNFSVKPGVLYTVNVSYMFGTTDYGEFNLFKIITGAYSKNPEKRSDLLIQGDTGHHTDEQEEVVWLDKNYSFNVISDENGTIYVNIGVWGTWETPRTYYVDGLSISIEEISYENLPDIEGELDFEIL